MPGARGGGPEIAPSTVSSPCPASTASTRCAVVGRDRVEVGDERPRVAGRRGDRAGDLDRRPGRHDAENDVRLVDERLQRPDVLDSGLAREASRPVAATVERDDDAHAAFLEALADRAPHRPAPTSPTTNAPGRIRTSDPRIRSPLLCPLSYGRSQGA